MYKTLNIEHHSRGPVHDWVCGLVDHYNRYEGIDALEALPAGRAPVLPIANLLTLSEGVELLESII